LSPQLIPRLFIYSLYFKDISLDILYMQHLYPS